MNQDEFFLVGFSFQETPVEIREKIYFRETQLNLAYQKAKDDFGLEDLVIVSTCNRVELYSASHDSTNAEGELIILTKLLKFVSHFHQQDMNVLMQYAYKKTRVQVVRHLYTVISSLDSMVVGENQILGQIKNAYYFHKNSNLFINRLFQSAIALGKKVRTKTEIGVGGVSIGSLSIDIVKNLFNKNDEFTICLLGAGAMAQECLKSLQTYAKAKVIICNRNFKKTQDKVKKLTKELNQQGNNQEYEVVDFDRCYEVISSSDIIICSTDAEHFLIEKETLRKQFIEKKKKIHLFIDLSVPRNIDPQVNDIMEVIYYSIDDLQKLANENKKKREQEIFLVNEIIDKSISDFLEWQVKTIFFNFFVEKGSLKKSDKSGTDKSEKVFFQSESVAVDVGALKQRYYDFVNDFLKKQDDSIIPKFRLDIKDYWSKVNKVIKKK